MNEMSDTSGRMVRILIIDDNLLIRHMLKMHIELASDLKVVGGDEFGSRSVDLVARYRPDVVLVDFDMLGSTGKKIVEELHQAVPEIPVIATSLNDSDTNVIIANEAGAIDFVTKQADSVALIQAIRRAITVSRPGQV